MDPEAAADTKDCNTAIEKTIRALHHKPHAGFSSSLYRRKSHAFSSPLTYQESSYQSPYPPENNKEDTKTPTGSGSGASPRLVSRSHIPGGLRDEVREEIARMAELCREREAKAE